MAPVIFLDRDGVIIENVDRYVRSWADVVLLPRAISALARLTLAGYTLLVVTNQSAVGRGLLSLHDAQSINHRLAQEISAGGGHISAFYLCPHTPEDHCACRKPQPGLLLRAAQDLAVDLSAATLVGDALTDIQAGQRAGIHCNVLVQTGRGSLQAALPEAQALRPFSVYASLDAYVTVLLADQHANPLTNSC